MEVPRYLVARYIGYLLVLIGGSGLLGHWARVTGVPLWLFGIIVGLWTVCLMYVRDALFGNWWRTR